MKYEEAAGWVNTAVFPQPHNLEQSGGVCAYTHLPATSSNTSTQLLQPEKSLSQEMLLEMTKSRNISKRHFKQDADFK